MSTAGEKVLSTADEVRRCKTTEQLIEFLGKQDLGLENKHFDILRRQEITGRNFLSLNVDELMQDGLKRGPAKTIAEFIEKIKGEEQETTATSQKIKELEEKLAMFQTSKEAHLYFQYLASKVHCISSGAWEDFIQLHKHLKECFNIEGPLENYVFIIGDKEMDFVWTKMQIIDFLNQQKCSIDNPVKISDKKKEKENIDSSKLIKFTKEEEGIVRKAFDRDFRDPSNLSERFMLFIKECLREYEKKKDYYAPYTTLIQASGTGKSKLLMYSAENVMTVFCCLRDPESSGYPSRSHIAKSLLDNFSDERTAIATYLAYICACYQKLREFKGSCKKWIDEHTNNNSQEDFWKDIEHRMNAITHDLKQYVTDKALEDRVREYYFEQKITTGESPVKCLFAFDEARTLVKQKVGDETLFYYVRRALKLLPKNAGIFAIFTDTHSKISNFSPARNLDPSQRVAVEGEKLFKPFYLLDTVDINMKNMGMNTEIRLEYDPTLEMSENPQHFFQYGRPLWGALLSPFRKAEKAEGFKPERVIELAMDKLVGGISFIHWKNDSQNKISITETLAIFGPRLCIDIVPQSGYASQLVASYMHLCLNISDDREYVITSMPTEPVLAEASARIMNNSDVGLTELINNLSSALKKGVVEAGYRGELTARLLLLKAWDNCIQKKHTVSRDVGNDYSRFVTINEFLRSLLADDVYKKIEDRLKTQVKFTGTTFGEAYIKFTHFINVTYTPTRQNLGDALIRGVAFSCKRNQRGVDIIIPIYMGALHERLNKDRISYILIQVKNWFTDNKGDDYPLSATAKLSPAYIDIEKLPHIPFLSLYLQLGAITEFFDVPTEFIQTRQVTLCKRKIDDVLINYQSDDIETRDDFIKKIRIDYTKDISGAEITAFREHFQTPLALFGLSPNIYNCLEQPTPASATSPSTITNDLTNSFKQLLTAWVDPTLGEHPEEMEVIKRMEPLVYNMEE